MTKKVQIILIPGIMGSTLEKMHNKIWPSYFVNIFSSHAYDKLMDIDDPDITAENALYLVYNKLEKALEKKASQDMFDVFSYDWRKNNLTQLRWLRSMLNNDADEIIIVAHSMGGIIAKLFLNEYRDDSIISKISTLVTMGTPWNGAPNSYESLLYGKEIKPILFKEQSIKLMKCFPSVYQLLPNENYMKNCEDDYSFYFKKDNRRLSWTEIYNDVYIPLLRENGIDEVSTLIDFSQKMNGKLPEGLVHHEVIGFGMPTAGAILDYSDEKMRKQFTNGDGTVPLYSAISNSTNKYFVKCKLNSDSGSSEEDICDHMSLPKNKNVINLIENIISGNSTSYIDDNIIYSYEKAMKEPFDYTTISIACPVSVSLIDASGRVLFGNMEELEEQEVFNLLYNSNSSIQNWGDCKYFILNKEQLDSKFYITGYDRGSVSIAINEYKDGKMHKSGVFQTFNIDESIKATLKINKNINETKVSVEKYNNPEGDFFEQIIMLDEKDKKLEFPHTKVTFLGDKLKQYKGKYYCMDNAKLKIDEVIKGTYDIKETWCVVNENKPMLLTNNFCDLELMEGKNIILVYSKDVFSNKEKPQKVEIYLLPEREVNIKVEFKSDSYSILPEFNDNDVYRDLQLSRPQIDVLLENKDGNMLNCWDNKYLYYESTERKFKVQFKDIFDTKQEYDFKIDEKIIKNVINSDKNSLKYVDEICKMLNIDEKYSIRAKLNINGRWTNNKSGKDIAPDKVINAKEIEIQSNVFNIKFKKDDNNIIAFVNLVETINMKSEQNYEFTFKAIDKNSKQDTKIDDLKVYIGIKDKNSEIKSIYGLNTNYNDKNKLYTSILSVKEFNGIMIDKEIYDDNFENIYLVLESKEDNITKVLRSNQIICRY